MLIGSSEVISIGIRVFLKNDVSGAATAAGNSLQQLKQQAQAYRAQLQQIRDTSMVGGMIGIGLIRGATSFLKTAGNLESSLAGVQAISGATNGQMKELRDTMRSTVAATAYAPQAIADAMLDLNRAGFTIDDLNRSMSAISKTALANGEDLGMVSELFINVLTAYNIPTARTAQVADMLTQAGIKSALSLADLKESLAYSSQSAMQLKVPLSEILSMTMALSQVGQKGSRAGTGIDNMLRYLVKAVGELGSGTKKSDALDYLGLKPEDIIDSRGELKSMIDILGSFGKALEAMPGPSREQLLWDIFGVRGMKPAASLTQNLQQLKQFQKDLQNSVGVNDAIAEQRTHNAGFYFASMANQFKLMWDEITIALTPMIYAFTKVLTITAQVIGLIARIPVVGTALFTFIAVLILWRTVMFGINFILSSLALNQGKVAAGGTSMATVLQSGWKTTTILAQEYLATLYQIQAAQAATSAGSMAGGMMGGGPVRMGPPGGAWSKGKAGWAQVGKGWRYRSASGAFAKAPKEGYHPNKGGWAYKNAGGGFATAPNTTKTGLQSASSIGTSLGFGVSMVPTPYTKAIGYGIMAVSLITGIIAECMPDNTAATEANTNATNENTGAQRKVTDGLARQWLNAIENTKNRRDLYKFVGTKNPTYDAEMEKRMYLYNSQAWGSKGGGGFERPFFDVTTPGKIDIYVKGIKQRTFTEGVNNVMLDEIPINPD